MKSLLYRLIWPALSAVALNACGSDTPSFVEKPEGIITVLVDSNMAGEAFAGEDQFDIDQLMADESQMSADAIAVSEGSSEVEDDQSEAEATADTSVQSKSQQQSPGKGDHKSQGKGKLKPGETESVAQEAAAGGTADSADSQAETSDASSTLQQTPGPVSKSYDARAVAMACAPLFHGAGQKIRVVDTSSDQPTLRISADTVLAFKVTGNQSKLSLKLPQGQAIAGLCFFVSGHESQVVLNSEAAVKAVSYIGAGDLSSGRLVFAQSSPSQASIELKGNQASLVTQGLDPSLCATASLKGHEASLQCLP